MKKTYRIVKQEDGLFRVDKLVKLFLLIPN